MTEEKKCDMEKIIEASVKAQAKKVAKLRKWFFTLWNIEFNFSELWEDYNDIVRFIKGQKERCPSTGKLHWQGVIHMYDPCRLTKMRKLLEMGKGEKSGDLKPQYSNKALEYVHKEHTSVGGRFCYGEPSKQGIRTDLRHIQKLIREGSSDWELMNEFPGQYQRYHKYFEKYRGLFLEKKSTEYIKQKVILISGQTDLGKTRSVLYDENNKRRKNVYKISAYNGLKWWNGYNGQDTILIDEFNNQVPCCKMLDILEGHQRRVEYKGGHTYLCCSNIYITTNLKKHQIYPGCGAEHRKAFFKRIDEFRTLGVEKRNEVWIGNTGGYIHTSEEECCSDQDDHDGWAGQTTGLGWADPGEGLGVKRADPGG